MVYWWFMRVHILGICGTFMAGLAMIAKGMGIDVSGSDENAYPPMSDELSNEGITVYQGYDPCILDSDYDMVIIGNVMKRGMPIIESLLDKAMAYMSGPEWLYQYVLKHKRVIAVSGTHGKTTTTSMLAWVLNSAGLNPGFLIGGVPENFEYSARITDSDLFVIEADEYDSAFFDKRSKFLHYRPELLLINNLEFDHSDIFSSLEEIQQQFSYLLRTVPKKGAVITPKNHTAIEEVMTKGCWSHRHYFGKGSDYQAELLDPAGSAFKVDLHGHTIDVDWSLIGEHNVNNALATIAICDRLGLSASVIQEGLNRFSGVKRRMQLRGVANDMTIYDDFAHHPSAILSTLKGLRAKVGKAPIIALVEFASFTMREGIHCNEVLEALTIADKAYVLSLPSNVKSLPPSIINCQSVDEMVNMLNQDEGKRYVIAMSNRAFGNIFDRLLSHTVLKE